MTLTDFIANFAKQFDDTDVSEIQASTTYKDLEEWSSLTAMSLIAFVKTSCGKILTGKEIRSCETVEDLYNLIESK